MKSVLVGLLLFSGGILARGADAVRIVDADYEGRPQLKITAAGATWFYDQNGGCFSRLIDRDGHDWIAFHKNPLVGTRAAAAAGYRGLPKLVHSRNGPDVGVGYAGYDLCETTRVADDCIRTVSKSGRWAWTWRFTATCAVFTMEKADATQPWWFLYEGPIAGRFAPHEQYWGTDLGGPRHETPNHSPRGDISGNWRWVYFGDRTVPRILFVGQAGGDALPDSFAFMGSSEGGVDAPDGMVAFGFGRRDSESVVKGAGLRFVVGLVEEAVNDAAAHARVKKAIEAELGH